MRLARENNIKYIHYGSKVQLGAIFDKPEVNLIGIKSKKVARGMTEQILGGIYENKST